MRVMLDANVLLDCLVVEADGLPRAGKAASERVLFLCDSGLLEGLVAWHTLPIVAYYHGRQNAESDTAAMMDALLGMLEVPVAGHGEAAAWRSHGITDFEDALQMASAVAGRVDIFLTRNLADFSHCEMAVMTPEQFLTTFPGSQ